MYVSKPMVSVLKWRVCKFAFLFIMCLHRIFAAHHRVIGLMSSTPLLAMKMGLSDSCIEI